jgi:hypothetical protein
LNELPEEQRRELEARVAQAKRGEDLHELGAVLEDADKLTDSTLGMLGAGRQPEGK